MAQLDVPGGDDLERDLARLTTEAVNPRSTGLDAMTALEIVRVMNAEDRGVVEAVAAVRDTIAAAVEAIAARLADGGRLLYAGAGTSGRLGVLDAAECPPTFCTPPDMVVGVIAGGRTALTAAVEGAEDDPDQGRRDLEAVAVSERDAVVGIAASGRTPYVLGALAAAREQGAFTAAISCNPDSPVAAACAVAITPVVGAEVLAGSTRLKAGTATKMVLNMLSTGAMVLLGKTHGNRMVDVRVSNAKLLARASRMVVESTGLERDAARALLELCDGEVKTALAAHGRGVDPERARALLAAAGGRLGRVLDER